MAHSFLEFTSFIRHVWPDLKVTQNVLIVFDLFLFQLVFMERMANRVQNNVELVFQIFVLSVHFVVITRKIVLPSLHNHNNHQLTICIEYNAGSNTTMKNKIESC